MVFFNYATMQMAAKIVYYGPGLCGKTTNLHVIYGRTAPTSRGEMVCLETETDRTLFFDLLPLDVGVIGGFKTRLQLYTVPGQVFYNTTRKLVLKGVDGIVFVADSQRPMKDPNVESLRNLRENLAEIGASLNATPRVFQYNKRDLANILTLDELNESLNPDGTIEWYESSATNGTGVFETLKAISKLTLRSLKGRMAVEQRRPTVVASATPPAAQVLMSSKAAASGIGAAIDAMATASAVATANVVPEDDFDSTISRLKRFQETARQTRDLDSRDSPADTSPALPLPAETAPFDAANFPQPDDPSSEAELRGNSAPARRRARRHLDEARARALERRHPLRAREAPEARDAAPGDARAAPTRRRPGAPRMFRSTTCSDRRGTIARTWRSRSTSRFPATPSRRPAT